jgi:type I restriction enzyme R subunit
LHPKGVEAKISESLPGKVFLERVKQLDILAKSGDSAIAERIKNKILEDVKSLPMDSIEVKDRQKDVEFALSPKLWDRQGLNPIDFLRKNIAPLMRYRTGVNPKEFMFLFNCERFNSSLLTGNKEMMEIYSSEISKALLSLPRTIDEVQKKEELLDKYTGKIFWTEPSMEEIQGIYETFMPLMKYKREEIVQPIILDMDDYIAKRQIIEYGPSDAPKQDYITNYREKVEKRIKELAEKHPTIQKIIKDESLIDKDLENLEDTLNSPELYITEDTLRKTYGKDRGNLVQLVKKIIGLYEFPDPAKEVENAFQTFIVENNKEYGADQVNFIRAIQTYFVAKKHIEYSDLYEPPFVNFGKSARMEEEDLKAFIDICSRLERELFVAEA